MSADAVSIEPGKAHLHSARDARFVLSTSGPAVHHDTDDSPHGPDPVSTAQGPSLCSQAARKRIAWTLLRYVPLLRDCVTRPLSRDTASPERVLH